MSEHISIQRKNSARGKIKDKLKVLQDYVANGVPEGAFVPKDETAFRLWEDKSLGLEKIGSPSTMNKPYNKALKQNLKKLLKQLTVKRQRREGRTQIVDSLRIEIQKKDQLVQDLTDQWHVNKHELDLTSQSERRLKNRVSELEKENADLTRKVTAVVGLRSISGAVGGENDARK